jgi:hypothetical protein
MANDLQGVATGGLLTFHDALYAYPSDMQHNGTLISGSGAATGLPRITLADAVTQRVKWVWAIPVAWDAFRMNVAVINENVGTGNVRWQFDYKYIVLGEGNVDGAVTATITVTLSSGSQFDWTYHQIDASELVTLGAFDDAPFMMCSLARLGGDGADTLAGGISVGVVAATRVDLT